MPYTPSSPGEPVSPRDDEPRWYEPVGPYAMVEPTDHEDEWSAASERSYDSANWRDVRCVEFGDVEEAADSRDPATPRIVEPAPAAAIREADACVSDLIEETATEQPGPLRNRLALGIARPFRLGTVAGALVLASVFLYKGGEMLAGFASATTPPGAVAEPARQAPTAAAATPERLPTPAVATAPAAGSLDPRIAEFLVGARAGEPIAQYNLAVLYALGDGITQDYATAASWFRKAAEGGHPAAQFNLAVMYERGLGLPADNEAAFAWYRRAAERGYPAAEYNLALAYAEGRGTRADPNAAARWYHDAAVQGIVPAIVNVAILYETGEGVARSLPDAYAWYRAAARRGDDAAGERALELFHALNGADKAQAVLMAAAVAEAMLEPAPAPPPMLPVAAAPAPAAPVSTGQPAVTKPAQRKNTGAARDVGAARRQPAG